MSIIILLIFNYFFYQIGKRIFEYWFNPITIYSFVWTGLISLYQLKLFKYYELSFETWFVVFLSFYSFFFGIILYYYFTRDKRIIYKPLKLSINEIIQNTQLIKLIILTTGLIALVSSLQNWYILLKEYDSVVNILINAQEIYQKRVDGEIKGVLPYTWAFGFVSIFFAAILSAKQNKFSFLTIFPLVAIVLKDLAMIARSNILFGFLEFGTVFILVKVFFNNNGIKIGRPNKRNIIIGFIMILILVIGSATIVRSVKGTIESFKASTNTLSKIRSGVFITPSLYLYLSSHVGVLNKYLLVNDEPEKTKFGQNTFESIYNILSKFDLATSPGSYQRGYYIPMWTNTGTYIREIHADFGAVGLIVIPFMLGFFSIYYWVKFFETGELYSLNILIHLILIIWFSFLTMITRQGGWYISLFATLIIIHFLSRVFNWTKGSPR